MNKYVKAEIFLMLIVFLFLGLKFHQDNTRIKYWVFFDSKENFLLKNINSSLEYQRLLLSKRSLERRTKVLPLDKLIDETDLPLNDAYLNEIIRLGFKPISRSKWLNGITLYLNEKEKKIVESLKFVKSVEKVRVFRYRPPENLRIFRKSSGYNDEYRYRYGESLNQNELIKTPDVHNLEITGKGVLIGMLDTGFNRSHESLEGVTVIDEYDFINRDDTTSSQLEQDSKNQENHGTMTLSTIGGFKEGKLIGTAFGSTFALAKTEIVPKEIAVEEDLWIEGLEWLDSIGCDIVSSSLGYADFSDENYYTPDDMDGKTAKVTIAADLAVEKGIVVVNSAGNERMSDWGTIIAPADGFNVLAVGAVNPDGQVSIFSSPGPTADGRIKPDVCAMGYLIYALRPGTYSNYIYSAGTSFSCPLTAGVAALILSANPGLTPFQVNSVLKATASKYNNPDNNYGWGIVNAYKAVLNYGVVFSNEPEVELENGRYKIYISAASRYGLKENSVKLFLSYTGGMNFREFNMIPSEDKDRYYCELPKFPDGVRLYFYFFAEDKNGNKKYYKGNSVKMSYSLVYGDTTFNGPSENNFNPHIPEKFTLRQNFPNPFNSSTILKLEIPVETKVELKIYDVLGREIISLFNKKLSAGIYYREWKGVNSDGVAVSSGIYFARAKVKNSIKTIKMTLIR